MINCWVCICVIVLTVFVNFFVKSWVLSVVGVFLSIFLITEVTALNEWLSWVGGLFLVALIWDSLMRIWGAWR